MFESDFPPAHFLHGVYGTEPFAEYCRRRGIPFAQDAGAALPADGLERWTSSLSELSWEEHEKVELDLARVNELAVGKVAAFLLRAAESGPVPADTIPGGAPVALWFLLHRPDLFHEVFLRREGGEGAIWSIARARAGLSLWGLDGKARAMEDVLRVFFRQANGGTPSCALDGHRTTEAYRFAGQVADRLQFVQLFTDEGRVAMSRVRPALHVAFAYFPGEGTVLLRCPLPPGDRAVELLRQLSAAAGVAPLGERPFYDLEPLKGPFRPLPDADDVASIRVRALHLRYPARAGRRQLKLETRASEGPFAIEEMLRAHAGGGILDELRVCYAELQLRLRVEGGTRDQFIRLWPDCSNLGPTPLGDRLRACLRRWGLCHGD